MAPRNNRGKGKNGEKKKKEEKGLSLSSFQARKLKMAPRNNRGKGKNGEKKKKEEKVLPVVMDNPVNLPDESSVVLKVYQPTEELRSYLDPYKSVKYQVKIEVYADCALR